MGRTFQYETPYRLVLMLCPIKFMLIQDGKVIKNIKILMRGKEKSIHDYRELINEIIIEKNDLQKILLAH